MGESRPGNDETQRSPRRTELVWPGKYDAEGQRVEVPRRAVPLRAVESYGTSVLPAEASPPPRVVTLEDLWKESAPREAPSEEAERSTVDGWRNRLYFGDNLVVMDSLMDELRGGIDLIYIDPPFATGQDFSISTRVGKGDVSSRKVRSQPALRGRAYRDAWGRDLGRYLSMLEPRLARMRELLAPTGSIVVHLDRRVAHHVKLVLDEIFGEGRAINEIVWCYTGPSSPGMRGFANKHDLLYWYAKGDSWTFNVDAVRLPYNESTKRNEGRRTGFTTGNPDLVVTLHPLGKYPEDWWVLPVEAPASRRRTGYPTQKPERLLERVLQAATSEGDLVADFFSGSGTTLSVAERLGRRWIGCDSSPTALHATRKRLLASPRRRPLDVIRPVDAAPPPRPTAHVKAQVEGSSVVIELTGLTYPDSAPLPPEVAARLDTWADLVDFWAVDWSADDEALRPGFVAYRTPRKRSLALQSSSHTYPPGTRARIRVLVVDVQGVETHCDVETDV